MFPWTVSRQCTPHSHSVVESYISLPHALCGTGLLSHVFTVYTSVERFRLRVVDLDPK